MLPTHMCVHCTYIIFWLKKFIFVLISSGLKLFSRVRLDSIPFVLYYTRAITLSESFLFALVLFISLLFIVFFFTVNRIVKKIEIIVTLFPF